MSGVGLDVGLQPPKVSSHCTPASDVFQKD